MKKIELRGNNGRGIFALVDDDNYTDLSTYKWYRHGGHGHTFYAFRVEVVSKVEGVRKQRAVLMHRQVMGYPNSPLDLDHIDRDGLNNQRANLRLVPHHLNLQNTSTPKNSSTGYKNVTKRVQKYRVRFRVKDKLYYSLHNTLAEAVAYRDFKRHEVLGIYA